MSSEPGGGLDPRIAARLKRDAAGLFPAIAQQYDTGEVLMLGWMDDEALHRTLTTGRCTYWSRIVFQRPFNICHAFFAPEFVYQYNSVSRLVDAQESSRLSFVNSFQNLAKFVQF